MDYEKRYKDALERVKKLYGQGTITESLGFTFPELKESEDVMWRNWLIGHLVGYINQTNYKYAKVCKEAITWLKKQGESDETKAKTFLINKGYPIDANGKIPTYEEMYDIIKEELEKQGENILIEEIKRRKELYSQEKEKAVSSTEKLSLGGRIAMLEELCAFIDVKQGEQKPTDNVEPKFHEGEWVTDGYIGGQITSIEDNYPCYKISSFTGNINISVPLTLQDNYHLWTIADAKDGDVLCYKDEISLYKHDIKNCTKQETSFGGFTYYCCYDGKRFISDSLYSLTEQDKIDIHPATKEQRDLLFQKIKEASYEWDAEKKELKKVEVKSENIKPKTLDPDKVIEWLDEHVPTKFEDMQNYVNQFKKDFGL